MISGARVSRIDQGRPAARRRSHDGASPLIETTSGSTMMLPLEASHENPLKSVPELPYAFEYLTDGMPLSLSIVLRVATVAVHFEGSDPRVKTTLRGPSSSAATTGQSSSERSWPVSLGWKTGRGQMRRL